MSLVLLLVHEHMGDPVLGSLVVGKELRAGKVEQAPIHKPLQARSLAICCLQHQQQHQTLSITVSHRVGGETFNEMKTACSRRGR